MPRPFFTPTDDQRSMARTLSGFGVPHDDCEVQTAHQREFVLESLAQRHRQRSSGRRYRPLTIVRDFLDQLHASRNTARATFSSSGPRARNTGL